MTVVTFHAQSLSCPILRCPTCSGTLGRHTARQQGVNGTLMTQQLQQGRDVGRVGEGNTVH